MIQIYRVYKWQLFGFFFFISICTLIKAQYAPNYQFENLDYIENEECNFKFFNTSSRKSFLSKKERKKLKLFYVITSKKINLLIRSFR